MPLPTLLGFLAVTPEGCSACLNLGVPLCKRGHRAALVEGEHGMLGAHEVTSLVPTLCARHSTE